MAIPLEQFVKQLQDSGILSGDTLNDFLPPKADPKDSEELARELVRQKKLTRFQVQEIYDGRAKSLLLGNYLLREKIGAGGMGQVFRAEHRRMHRTVAVKLLPAPLVKDPSAIARFEREVTAAAKLNHPNIVTAYDADQANGVHFLVMELVDGSDLSALVKKNGPLSVERAVDYTLQAARGLQAAHAAGIIHRDIKPANLLLDKKGTVKILDMGLAHLHADGDAATQAELTTSGAVLGTVDYMAPEQALGSRCVDARADIYSLGCSLFYLLTGEAIYRGDSVMAKLLAHREQPIPSVRAMRPQTPETVEVIFHKMVAKNAADRYQSATDLIADLQRCAGQLARLPGELPPRNGPPVDAAATPSRPAVLHKAWPLATKLAGGICATILAPILVTYFVKWLDRDDAQPAQSVQQVQRVDPHDLARPPAVPATDLLSGSTGGAPNRVPELESRGSLAEREALTRQLPAPSEALEALRREAIPRETLSLAGDGDPNRAPASLVAVLGEPRPIQTREISTIAFSPDGRWLASGSHDKSIFVEEVTTHRVSRILKGHTGPVSAVAFSRDGGTLISASHDGTIKLWPIERNMECETVNPGVGSIGTMSVSRDGRYVAAAGLDRGLSLWKWGAWDSPQSLAAAEAAKATALAFSPDGELLAAGWDENKPEAPIRVYRTVNGQLSQSLAGHAKRVNALAFGADANYLASGGKDSKTRFWDLASSQVIAEFGNRYANAVALSPDGNLLAVSQELCTVNVYDLPSRRRLQTLSDLDGWAKCLAFSADGKIFAAGTGGGFVQRWDTSASEQRLPTATQPSEKRAVEPWETATWKHQYSQAGHSHDVTALAFGPDGRTVLSGGTDYTLRRWNLQRPGENQVLHDFGNRVKSVRCSHDGQAYAVSVGCLMGGSGSVWDATSDKARFLLDSRSDSVLDVSQDDKLLAGQSGNIVYLWGINARAEVHRFPRHQDTGGWGGPIFSFDGKLVAAWHTNDLKVWNADTGEEVFTLTGLSSNVSSAAFCPDGTKVATGQNGEINLWGLADGKKRRTLKGPSGAVTALQFTPDGTTLISAAHDGKIRLWNPNLLSASTAIRLGPASRPLRFALDPSGKYLVAGGQGPLIYVLRLP